MEIQQTLGQLELEEVVSLLADAPAGVDGAAVGEQKAMVLVEREQRDEFPAEEVGASYELFRINYCQTASVSDVRRSCFFLEERT